MTEEQDDVLPVLSQWYMLVCRGEYICRVPLTDGFRVDVAGFKQICNRWNDRAPEDFNLSPSEIEELNLREPLRRRTVFIFADMQRWYKKHAHIWNPPPPPSTED